MISVREAKEIVRLKTPLLSKAALSLEEAAGCLLAEDIFAHADFPPFAQSSVDGYAIRFADLDQENLLIRGEAQAGGSQRIKAGRHEAVRIFTGAPVPLDTDTVVMQEKVSVTGNCLQILDNQLSPGSNVRPRGSEIAKDSLALEKGICLSPAAIAFAAGLGKTSLQVIPRPKISLIVTGKELRQPGTNLNYGQVYESNSFSLTAALAQWQMPVLNKQVVDDDMDALVHALQTVLPKADLILMTGGVSVGEYDYAVSALEQCGVEKLFHTIHQRPGKPLYFGKRDNTLVFGLPGNPSSVLTCFYEYVLEALQHLTGLRKISLQTIHSPMAVAYTKKAPLTHFLKGIRIDNTVMPLGAQESYRMKSFAVADCLIVLEKDKNIYEKGEWVEVHLLP
jgi:molybdopterin molybdotransferase